MIHFAIIKRIDNGKRVGVVAHDPSAARVAFTSTDGLLRDVLGIKFGEPTVFRVTRLGSGYTSREPLPLIAPDYLQIMIHKLPPPYSVYAIGRKRQGDLDSVLKSVYAEHVGDKDAPVVSYVEKSGKIVRE